MNCSAELVYMCISVLLKETAEHELPVTHVSSLAFKTGKDKHNPFERQPHLNRQQTVLYAGHMLYCQTRHAKQLSSRHTEVMLEPATQGS